MTTHEERYFEACERTGGRPTQEELEEALGVAVWALVLQRAITIGFARAHPVAPEENWRDAMTQLLSGNLPVMSPLLAEYIERILP